MQFFQTAQQLNEHFVKMLVYGPGGAGKTLLTATAPRPLLLSAEAGTLSLSAANIAKTFGAGRTDVAYNVNGIVISNLMELQQAYQFCTTSHHMANFETVVLDSVSEIAEKVLAAELKNTKDGRKAYGAMNETISALLRQFRDIPNKHVYFSAKLDREIGANNAVISQPGMPGKTLTQAIPYFFDEVFSLEISPKQPDGTSFRYLRTTLSDNCFAKDRSGALAEFEPPHLGQIITKIQAYVKRS